MLYKLVTVTVWDVGLKDKLLLEIYVEFFDRKSLVSLASKSKTTGEGTGGAEIYVGLRVDIRELIGQLLVRQIPRHDTEIFQMEISLNTQSEGRRSCERITRIMY